MTRLWSHKNQWGIGTPITVLTEGPGDTSSDDTTSASSSLIRTSLAVPIQLTWGGLDHQVVEITGSEGAIRSVWAGAMDRTDKPIFSITAQGRGEDAPVQIGLEHPSGEIFEIQEYIRLALDELAQGRSIYTVEKARNLVKLCLAAEQSAREGRRIELK